MDVEDNVKLPDAAEQAAVGSTAYALDFSILIRYALLARQLNYTSRAAYLANVIIGTIMAIVFEIYLVKRFGGSPGKIIQDIRIVGRQ